MVLQWRPACMAKLDELMRRRIGQRDGEGKREHCGSWRPSRYRC